MALEYKTTIRNRMDVIAPLVRSGRVLDLGIVDSRRERHRTEDRLEKLPNLLFRQICEINPATVGVDIDEEGIEILARQGYQVMAGDVTKIDLGEQFDTIIAGEIIEHLENPGLFLRNMRKHLHPAGVLVITTPNPFYFKQVWKIFRRNRPQVHEEHTCWFDPITLNHLCEVCGFQTQACYWIQKNTFSFKTWPRLLRNYFSHSFLLVVKPRPCRHSEQQP